MRWPFATVGRVAGAALFLAIAFCLFATPAGGHNPFAAGEAPGNPLGLLGIPFQGPAGTTIEDDVCPSIPDSLAPSYDDPDTFQNPPGWGHIGHIAGVNAPGSVITNYIADGTVDMFHLEGGYNDPSAIEGPHPANDVIGSSVMMGPDGFFRGRMQETVRDEAGVDLVITDVHDKRTYCIYGALEHDGPYLFIDSTFNDPTETSVTQLDLSVFFTPLFEEKYPGDDDPRMDYVFLVTSAYQDQDQVNFTPPEASFEFEPFIACGSNAIVFTATASDPDGQVVSITWTFGDGFQGSGTTTSHTYPTIGPYLVALTVEDNDGLVTVVTRDVSGVEPANCCPTLDVPDIIRIVEGAHVGFTALGYDIDLDPLTYALMPFEHPVDFTLDGVFDWQTVVGDAGWYTAVIEVSDGQCAVQRPVRIGVHLEETFEAVEDRDWDSIEDDGDNCPGIRNREQQDADGDGIGDACEGGAVQSVPDDGTPVAAAARADADGDGVPDAADLCPQVADRSQADGDVDGEGDACDIDADGDLVPEQGTTGLFLDNCPSKANADQKDRDGDGIGDACDAAAPTAAGRGRDGVTSGAQAVAPAESWGLLLAIAAVVSCVVVGAAALVALRRPRRAKPRR